MSPALIKIVMRVQTDSNASIDSDYNTDQEYIYLMLSVVPSSSTQIPTSLAYPLKSMFNVDGHKGERGDKRLETFVVRGHLLYKI